MFRRATAGWALGGLLLGCSSALPLGNEDLGSYGMVAEPVRGLRDGGVGEVTADGGLLCALPEVAPGALRFEVKVRRESSSGNAWLTVAEGYVRDAGWNGQFVDSEATAPRVFPSCSGCSTVLATERLHFAILSRSQSEAVGRTCPRSVDDGGIPRPPGPDGGVRLPGQTKEGFDGLYACGELSFTLQATAADGGESCPAICSECVIHYTLQGERR